MKVVTLFLLLLFLCLSRLIYSQTDTVITFYDSKARKEFYLTDGVIKNGLYQIFHESGKLWQIGNYTNGELTDEWRVYDNNGVLVQSSNYFKNKLQGQQKYYFGNGFIKQLLFFKEGVLDGIAQLYANQGFLSKSYLSEEISFKDGMKDGRYIKYNETGDSVVIGKFKLDLRSGSWRHYGETGSLVKEEKFINDICENSIYYYDSGELKKQIFTLNDSLNIQFAYLKTGELKSKLGLLNSSAHGNYIEWYKSGLEKTIGQFIENRKTGKWEFFLEDGTKKEYSYN
jgi:antitoxin component YwqK of YwqJK toxin-antitoxin module